MKIIVLMKRFGSGKDSVKQEFGRVIKLFQQVNKNHDVSIIAFDHFKKETLSTHSSGIKVEVIPLSTLTLPMLMMRVMKKIRKDRPQLIFATSHPILGLVGLICSILFSIPLAYDIQDNYKTYTQNPFRLGLEKLLLKRCIIKSCASNRLAQLNGEDCIVIPNGYNPKIVKKINKIKCRKNLNLPNKKIFCYSGGYDQRGLGHLITAYKKIQNTNTLLLLVGDELHKKYSGIDGVLTLKSMAYDKLFVVINACDVMILPYEKNEFTKVMLAPYKLVEYMACGKPIVVSDAGEMQKLAPKFVYPAGDAAALSKVMLEALTVKEIDYPKLKYLTWEKLGQKLSDKISSSVI